MRALTGLCLVTLGMAGCLPAFDDECGGHADCPTARPICLQGLCTASARADAGGSDGAPPDADGPALDQAPPRDAARDAAPTADAAPPTDAAPRLDAAPSRDADPPDAASPKDGEPAPADGSTADAAPPVDGGPLADATAADLGACPVAPGTPCVTPHPGPCAQGRWACDGAEPRCVPDLVPEARAETCDGVDEDCDGVTDETPVDLPVACPRVHGVCAGAAPRCVGGVILGCDPADYGEHYEAVETRCDGRDNDCDGNTDPGCDCVGDATRGCGTDVGPCTFGLQSCVDGEWGECVGGVRPGEETCDGVDEDCDGRADEGTVERLFCSVGEGACARSGRWACIDGEVACDATPGPAADETCNGVDDDCDGTPDEATDDAPLCADPANAHGRCAAQGCVADCVGDWRDVDGQFANGCERGCPPPPMSQPVADGVTPLAAFSAGNQWAVLYRFGRGAESTVRLHTSAFIADFVGAPPDPVGAALAVAGDTWCVVLVDRQGPDAITRVGFFTVNSASGTVLAALGGGSPSLTGRIDAMTPTFTLLQLRAVGQGADSGVGLFATVLQPQVFDPASRRIGEEDDYAVPGTAPIASALNGVTTHALVPTADRTALRNVQIGPAGAVVGAPRALGAPLAQGLSLVAGGGRVTAAARRADGRLWLSALGPSADQVVALPGTAEPLLAASGAHVVLHGRDLPSQRLTTTLIDASGAPLADPLTLPPFLVERQLGGGDGRTLFYTQANAGGDQDVNLDLMRITPGCR